VSKVRQARIDELAKRTASPSEIADQAIASRLFGAYPYGHPASGTLDSLAKVDRADLLLAHDRFLNADNATVAIVGGVEKTRLMRALRQLLGPWQKSDRTIPATFRQPNAPDSRVLLISQLQAKSAEIRLAVRGLARSDRDLAAASMLAQIVRERWQSAAPDLSSAFVRHEAHALPGMFVLGASAPAGSAGKAIASAQEIMRSLAQNGPTPAETERARSAVLAAISKRAAQPDAVVDSWLDSETYKLGQIDNQTAAVGGVTAADVQRVATKLFKDAPQAAVVVGDADQLKSALGSSVEFRSDKLKTKTASEPPPPPKKP